MSNFFSSDKLIFICGPCVIEEEEVVRNIAQTLKKTASLFDISLVFKASFDKANRSSLSSYRGPGLEKGLKILASIKKDYDLMVTSDVHTPQMIAPCAEVLDVLQIPAFLARQTDLYIEAAKSKRPINVKKGQFMAPEEMRFAIEKFRQSGGDEIAITERGSFFGYGNLVVDFRSIAIIKEMGVPYIYDASHSLQKPAAGDGVSKGDRKFIEGLARAQIAAGADGIFLEAHSNPKQAKSDRETQYPLEEVNGLIERLLPFYEQNKKVPIKKIESL